jgi:uncharacterized OB-fold protein
MPREEFTLAYSYKRSLGPVLGAFFSALAEGRTLGARTATGRVLIPPSEADPETGEDIVGLVEVGPEGTIEAWTWIASPLPRHPMQVPFAWALIRPDGSDTAWVQAVSASSPDQLVAGQRVRPRLCESPTGSIQDLVYELV